MSLSEEDREQLIAINIQKSHQAIKEAELLSKNDFSIGALNRIYYGVFYIISALALKKHYRTSKHSQLIGWFNKNYVRNLKVSREIGKFVYKSFEQRMESDYNPLSKFTIQEISNDIERMKQAIKEIEKIVMSDAEST